MKIDTICDECINAIKDAGYNDSTIFNYQGVIRRFKAFCKEKNENSQLVPKKLSTPLSPTFRENQKDGSCQRQEPFQSILDRGNPLKRMNPKGDSSSILICSAFQNR